MQSCSGLGASSGGGFWEYLFPHLHPRPRLAASAVPARMDPRTPSSHPLHLHRDRRAHARAAEGGGPDREGSCGPSHLPTRCRNECLLFERGAQRWATRTFDPAPIASPRLQTVRPRAHVPRSAGPGKPGCPLLGPRGARRSDNGAGGGGASVTAPGG